MTRLVALVFVLFFSCVLSQHVGGTNGPCSATFIPPPYNKPLTIYDTNVGASPYYYPCGTPYTSPVVWYTISSQVGTNVTVTTCGLGTNFDTVIYVLPSTSTCNNLTCLNYNDQANCVIGGSGNTTNIVNTSTLSFNGTDSLVYIGVGGYYSYQGNYQLTITVVNTTTNGGNSGNNNFGCQNATSIYGPYDSEVTVFANNINATTGFSGFNSTTCSIAANQYSVWYKIFPVIGARLNITTCNPATNFDTVVSVFAGSSCSSLNCTARSDDSCIDYRTTASSVSFVPSTDLYYVVVSGYGSSYGTFEISFVQEPASSNNSTNPPVSGNSCATAQVITVGNVYNGSLVGAPLLTENSCNVYTNRSAGWHVLTVNQTGPVTVSTCVYETSFDTVLLVFSGYNCTNLSCIGNNDDAPCTGALASSSSLTFQAIYGITYYVVVLNYFAGQTGVYGLSVN